MTRASDHRVSTDLTIQVRVSYTLGHISSDLEQRHACDLRISHISFTSLALSSLYRHPDPPAIVQVNMLIRSIARIEDVTMVSRDRSR